MGKNHFTAAVRSNVRQHARHLWIYTGVVAVLSVPPTLLFPVAIAEGEPMAWVLLYFPLITLWPLTLAIKATREAKRTGPVVLKLDPYPGAIGGEIGGRIYTRLRLPAQQSITCTLSCSDVYRTDDPRDVRRHADIVWRDAGPGRVAAGDRGSTVDFRFQVPGGLPQSGDPTERGADGEHVWQVQVELPNLSNKPTFDIPAFAGKGKARQVRTDTSKAAYREARAAYAAMQAAQPSAAASGGEVAAAPDAPSQAGAADQWTRLRFKPRQDRDAGRMLGGLGLVLLILGFYFLIADESVAGFLFSLLAAAALIHRSLQLLTWRIDLRFNRHRIVALRRELGRVTERHDVAAAGIREFSSKANSLGDYQLYVVTGDGEEKRLADGLKDRQTALVLRDEIVRRMRIGK